MQNFSITPTQVFTAKSISFTRADGSVDTGFSTPITFSVDKPTLASVENISAPVQVAPILPAASAGGVVTVSGTFKDENSVTRTQQFTVTINANPNPAVGFLVS